jgi:hypothetical protein
MTASGPVAGTSIFHLQAIIKYSVFYNPELEDKY